jgi:hypothetical protein
MQSHAAATTRLLFPPADTRPRGPVDRRVLKAMTVNFRGSWRELSSWLAYVIGAALVGLLWAGRAHAIDIRDMRLDGPCKAIILNGDIARNEALDFIKRMVAAAERCGTRIIIVQKMLGGSVNDALAIGEEIRSREYVTAMLSDSICASACGLIYLGGVQRYWREGARFIIHRPEIRVATPFKSITEADQAYDQLKVRLIRYVASMGASPDYVDLMYVEPNRPGPSETTLERLDMMRLSLFTHTGVPF